MAAPTYSTDLATVNLATGTWFEPTGAIVSFNGLGVGVAATTVVVVDVVVVEVVDEPEVVDEAVINSFWLLRTVFPLVSAL